MSRTDTPAISTALMIRAGAFLGLQCQLAEELKSRFGASTVLIANSKQDLETYRRLGHDPAIFADTVYADLEEMNAVKEPPLSREHVYAEVRRVETAHKIRLIDSIRADRLYGMGFITGADVMRTPFMLKADYSHILAVAARVANFMAAAIDRFSPQLIVGFPGTLATDLVVAIAQGRGISMRGLGTRRRELFFY